MAGEDNQPTSNGAQGKRTYRAPKRQAAAERTREAILAAAQRTFEEHGWSSATIRIIAGDAGVSPKTVEAIFGTKAALLEAVVAYAIRGDSGAEEMPTRTVIMEMEAAPDAPTMLDLHAAHLRRVNQRSAAIAWVVEHAAASGGQPAQLWAQMNRNRAFGVHWATTTLLTKPNTGHLTPPYTDTIFWVGLDWATYRTLSRHAKLSGDDYEQWLRGYYHATLLNPTSV